MSLSVELVNNILAVKVNPCKDFYSLRQKLLLIPNKEAEYGEDQYFKYWKMPVDNIFLLLEKFSERELDISSDLLTKVDEYKTKFTKLADCVESVNIFKAFDGKDLFKHQSDYVSISKSKKHLL